MQFIDLVELVKRSFFFATCFKKFQCTKIKLVDKINDNVGKATLIVYRVHLRYPPTLKSSQPTWASRLLPSTSIVATYHCYSSEADSYFIVLRTQSIPIRAKKVSIRFDSIRQSDKFAACTLIFK